MPPKRTSSRYGSTQTPPNTPQGALRVRIFILYSCIGLYLLGTVMWGIGPSASFSNFGKGANVHWRRQLRRQKWKDTYDNNVGMTINRNWMEQLLKMDRPPELRCIGWKQTDSCNLPATELPTRDRGCDQFVRGGAGGYCVMEDDATGQKVEVMHTACGTLFPSVAISCRHGSDFVRFQWQVAKLAAAIQHERESAVHDDNLKRTRHREGIVMVIYPKLLVSAYASIRTLRAINCTLPIELWYCAFEMDMGNGTSLLDGIPKKLQQDYGPVTLRAIIDAQVIGFNSKVYAITNSEFEHVLFLDSDNVAVRDPSYLFNLPEFEQTGAIFWPDFWHPGHTIFNIHDDSLLWELLDMPFIDMFEQESGQLLIDKTKCSAPLRMLNLLAFHDPNLFSRYKLTHGDKDLFRLAWLKTNSPFHMIAYPPGIAGTVRATKFCGMSMVQYDTTGQALFLHRNARKITGGIEAENTPDEKIWTHLQRFRYRASSLEVRDLKATVKSHLKSSIKYMVDASLKPSDVLIISYQQLCKKYSIQIYGASPEFHKAQWCYGQPTVTAPMYKTSLLKETAFFGLEDILLNFANDAVTLLSKSAVEYIADSIVY
ncbi:uncharacterized protein CCR75_003271 [Bremia lactucae]|uniref:Nucleotide-diphospho-sugar transferase n=1 Tax=Bremia lactucae TaxID=4779 RepID=A0A976NYH1_BRELC|nr:hypothetical protein CCR75_005780 [Bremia lactucae]TDH70393.1 hypothetical protein CCR75_000351 [Bremia lactucae]TDH72551.1 hypothetical protein CCR75_003271 [Bremia lactucae]